MRCALPSQLHLSAHGNIKGQEGERQKELKKTVRFERTPVT